jgi:acetyl esterase
MRLAPQVQALFDTAPEEPLDALTVQQQRQLMRRLSDENYLRFGLRPEPVGAVTDHAVPTDDGTITVRAYRPAKPGPLPGHVELHGGGWWLGSIDEHVNDAICRHRCNHAGCAVFAVEYRLAPEHAFPAGLDDVYSAVLWIAGHAAELGVDPGRISIGGASAGGNLAAATTLRARDTGGPDLVFQLLEVPGLDLTGASMRAALATEELAPIAHYIGEFETPLRHYFRDPADALLPLASPIRASDLSGLPPAHIVTAEYDPLRAEGELYAQRLAEAGVDVTVTRHAEAIHGTGYLTGVWEPAWNWLHGSTLALRQAHERSLAVRHTAPGSMTEDHQASERPGERAGKLMGWTM